MTTPDYGASIQRDCADHYSQRCAQADAQARHEAEMAHELVAATLATGGLMDHLHGNETSDWVSGARKKRPELVWETLRGMADYRDFDRRLIGVFALACRHGIPGANDLLQDMATLYAHLNAEEIDIEGVPV